MSQEEDGEGKGGGAMSVPLKPGPSRWASDGELDPRVSLLNDADLIDLARQGIGVAVEVLWVRHVNAGLYYARRHCGVYEPEDIVGEAYARILRLLRDGQGPRTNFRSYLLTTIKNMAINDGARQSATPVGDWDELPQEAETDDFQRADERSAVSAVLYAMRPRYRQVLWMSEVEGLAPGEIASQLGMSSANVSLVLYRAKNQFKKLYLDAEATGLAQLNSDEVLSLDDVEAAEAEAAAAKAEADAKARYEAAVKAGKIPAGAGVEGAVGAGVGAPQAGADAGAGATPKAGTKADKTAANTAATAAIAGEIGKTVAAAAGKTGKKAAVKGGKGKIAKAGPHLAGGALGAGAAVYGASGPEALAAATPPPLPPALAEGLTWQGGAMLSGKAMAAMAALVAGGITAGLVFGWPRTPPPEPGVSPAPSSSSTSVVTPSPTPTITPSEESPVVVEPVPSSTSAARPSPAAPTTAPSSQQPPSSSQQPPSSEPVVLPPLTITGVDNGPGGVCYPQVSGTGLPGSTISVGIGMGGSVTVTVGPDGQWQTGRLGGWLPGRRSLVAWDPTGAQTPANGTVTLEKPPNAGVSGPSGSLRVQLSGLPGQTVAVYADGELVGTVTLDATGWADKTFPWQGGTGAHKLAVGYTTPICNGPTMTLPFNR